MFSVIATGVVLLVVVSFLAPIFSHNPRIDDIDAF